jgi:iron-sulfur cluster assembly protein
MPLVSRDMRIGALIEAYPHLVRVLSEAGVHCVGCGVSSIESIEDGLRHHGHSEERIDEILEKLERAALNPRSLPDEPLRALEITLEAAVAFGNVIRERNRPGCSMRITAHHGATRFEIDDTTRHDDQILTIGGTRFLIDSDSRGQLASTRIDYAEGLFRIER